jgi:predicted O-linked N-acetylglucosamine transferase (SPINDLY family)
MSATDAFTHALALGNAHEDNGEIDAALTCYRQALAIAPDNPRAHLNLANALRARRDYADALAALRHALTLDPGYAHAHFNLGLLLAETGDRAAATAAFDTASRLDPALAAQVIDAKSYLLFTSALREVPDPVVSAREHFSVGTDIAALAGPPFDRWTNACDSTRKLHIGYVSGDLGVHPISLFLGAVLPRHDRARYEIHCYSSNIAGEPVIDAVRRGTDHLTDIAHSSDSAVADRIRADGIDVLVDLAGHTQNNRLGVFARHPAPVQASWLGYLNTTGLTAMDYRICDRFTDPVGATEHLHTERLYRMPHSQWCYQPWCDVPPTPRTPTPGTLVFGSCNQFAKLSEPCLDLWCEILRRLPDAEVEILDVRDGHSRASLVAAMDRRGIEARRLRLRGRASLPDYYRTVGGFDVALDTYPYNGGTTTLDTLWMGVPLVALKGELGVSRSSYSILSNLELPELIAESRAEYIDLNLRLALDATWRESLRGQLRNRLATSPLMDVAEFVTDLETAYRTMWRAWCDRQAAG